MVKQYGLELHGDTVHCLNGFSIGRKSNESRELNVLLCVRTVDIHRQCDTVSDLHPYILFLENVIHARRHLLNAVHITLIPIFWLFVQTDDF